MPSDLASTARRWAPYALGTAGLFVLLLASTSLSGSSGFGYDFRAYDEAARRIASGAPLYPADTAARHNAGAFAGLYLYPPQLAIAFVPLTVFSSGTATIIWLWFRVGLLVGGCAVLPVRRWVRVAIFGVAGLSFPVLYDLNLGNISVVVFALSALVWRLGPDPRAGVVFAVLAAIRHPSAAIAVAWAAMGRWRTVAVGIGTGIVLLVLALPIVGIGGYADYVTLLRGLHDLSVGPDNLSLQATLLGVGVPAGLASAAELASMAAAAAFTWWVARHRDGGTATVVALTAPLLVAPFFHPHYLVALLIPGALLADRGRPWGLALPLLGWLPGPILPLVAAVALVAPIAAPDRQTATASLSRTVAAPSS